MELRERSGLPVLAWSLKFSTQICESIVKSRLGSQGSKASVTLPFKREQGQENQRRRGIIHVRKGGAQRAQLLEVRRAEMFYKATCTWPRFQN